MTTLKKRALTFASDFDTAPELNLSEADLIYQKKADNPDEHTNKLGLQAISIRLQPELLNHLKTIAQHNGMGYQTLIKQVLHRFVNAEMKMLAAEKQKEMRLQALEEELQAIKKIQQEMEAQRYDLEQKKLLVEKTA